MPEIDRPSAPRSRSPSDVDPATRRFRQDPRERPFFDDPWRLYARLHRIGGPLYWEDYGMWCLAGFAAVDRTLRDRRFRRLPPAGHEKPPYPPHLADFAAAEAHSLLALEPPEHTRLRKLVNRAFVSRQVRRMAPGIRAVADACLDRVEADGGAELLAAWATPIPVTVIARLIGVPDEETDDLLAWSHAMVRVYTMTQTREEEVLADEAARAFRDRLLALIAEKRRRPADDLISHLLALRNLDTPLADEEIVSVAILLLNAGHEATVHQLGNAVRSVLSRAPGSPPAASLFATPERTEATVAELLRHDAPLHLFVRHAQEDVALGAGVTLARGEPVALLLGAANRDPARFDRPEAFDPTRPDAGHVTLGGGIHYCVGAQLAKLELGIALGALFERFPTLALDGEPRCRDSYHFHGLETLPVRW